MGKQLMRKAAVMKESGKSEKAAKYRLTFALVLEMSVAWTCVICFRACT